jgi:hypothetical protein
MAIDGGYGRNQIVRELNNRGVKISTTTVTYLIQDWKHQHQHQPQQEQAITTNEPPLRLSQQSSPQSPQTLSPQSQVYSESLQSMSGDNSSISTGIDMNNTDGSSLLMARHGSGIGQAVITNSNSNVIPRDGGPLSHLLCDDNSTDEEEVITPVTSYSNLPSSVPPTVSMSLYPNTNIPSNFNPYFNPYQNNINPQISKPETQESPQLKPQPQHQQYHDVNNGSNYDDQEIKRS